MQPFDTAEAVKNQPLTRHAFNSIADKLVDTGGRVAHSFGQISAGGDEAYAEISVHKDLQIQVNNNGPTAPPYSIFGVVYYGEGNSTPLAVEVAQVGLNSVTGLALF